MKISISLFASIAAGVALAATPQVKNVKAFQQYPWGSVCISYEVVEDVSASIGDSSPLLLVLAEDKGSGQVYGEVSSGERFLTGDTGCASGLHKIVWDIEGQGLAIDSSNVTFTVMYGEKKYLVIDLSSGASSSSYPVVYLTEEPYGGFNVDKYKTSKLVLRRIEPGSIPTRDAALTQPYYIGVFEVTQRQYELVMGTNPSASSSSADGGLCPVENVTYDMLRGSRSGVEWPNSSAVDYASFFGRIRAKTGMSGADLPTEAQWEYACRAGTATTYSYGDSEDGNYMWYYDNSLYGNGSRGPHVVGTKQPNAWGLYDMHGNVWELCLDWYSNRNVLTGDDPVGPNSSTGYRVRRGGSWSLGAEYSTSSYRSSTSPSYDGDGHHGFRLVMNMSY